MIFQLICRSLEVKRVVLDSRNTLTYPQTFFWRAAPLFGTTVHPGRDPNIFFQLFWNDAIIGNLTGKFGISHKNNEVNFTNFDQNSDSISIMLYM